MFKVGQRIKSGFTYATGRFKERLTYSRTNFSSPDRAEPYQFYALMIYPKEFLEAFIFGRREYINNSSE